MRMIRKFLLEIKILLYLGERITEELVLFYSDSNKYAVWN